MLVEFALEAGELKQEAAVASSYRVAFLLILLIPKINRTASSANVRNPYEHSVKAPYLSSIDHRPANMAAAQMTASRLLAPSTGISANRRASRPARAVRVFASSQVQNDASQPVGGIMLGVLAIEDRHHHRYFWGT